MTVKELAKELCITEEMVRWLGKIPNDQNEMSTKLANYVRLRHLEKTHPWLCSLLSRLVPPCKHDYDYGPWGHELYKQIMAQRGQNGGQQEKKEA